MPVPVCPAAALSDFELADVPSVLSDPDDAPDDDDADDTPDAADVPVDFASEPPFSDAQPNNVDADNRVSRFDIVYNIKYHIYTII